MNEFQQQVLRDRGLVKRKYNKKGQSRITSAIPEDSKTAHMKLIELRLKRPIEELLMMGSLSEVAVMIGVDRATVSKWIKRFNLREG